MKKLLINKYPATRWNDATPVGNGLLGGCVYGCVYDERILINHEALFNWCDNSKELPDIAYALDEVRELMDKKEYKKADSLYIDILKEKGYRPSGGKFYPAFDLHLLFENKDAFTDYQRVLDLENSVCSILYKERGKQYTREIFAPQAEKAIFVTLKGETPFDVKFALEKHELCDLPDAGGSNEITTEFFGNSIYAEFKSMGGLHYSGMAKLCYTDGTISINADGAKSGNMSGNASLESFISISNATNIVIAIAAEKTPVGAEKLDNALTFSSNIDEILANHKKAFSSLFNRTSLSLSNKENVTTEELLLKSYDGYVDPRLIEKMADFGRYLLISSSIGCHYPANLQGMWNGDYSPAWGSTYFNNENIQMAYWQACRGGLPEALLPFFELYDSFKPDFRENARKLYGCKGLLLPLFMDNDTGKKKNLQSHVLYWTGSSAWVSAMYYEYYSFTKDEEFLKTRAYPFMRECAEFYEDFYVYDERGKLKSYPSNSPENQANGSFDGAGKLSIAINPTMDFALLKELLTNLISSAKLLQTDAEKICVWEKMLSAIPDYEINEDGAIKEWLHEDFKDNYHHRHQSHIYPLFPGYEIDSESGALFDAIKVAVDKRLVIGLRSQTGWSLSHMANIYARLKDGESTKRCLDLLLRFCTGPNLFTYHNDWRNMGVTLKMLHAGKAPFQIDANMGFTAAIYEMLVFSNGEKIELLPALPEELDTGSISCISTQSQVDVEISWDNATANATLFAKQDTSFDIRCIKYPILKKCSIDTKASAKHNGCITITLKAGEKCNLSFTK